MMLTAVAWTADWFNGWLAAIGATLLVPDLTLDWTDDPRPAARFDGVDDVISALAAAFPARDELAQLASSRHLDGRRELTQKTDVDTYADRATWAREHGDWSLGALLTDLAFDPKEPVTRSPLNTPAPKGLTITDRFVNAHDDVPGDVRDGIRSSMSGTLRVAGNGLGFDVHRLTAPTDPVGNKWADPVVEVLAFVGLTLLPCRGDGRRQRTRLQRDDGTIRWASWATPMDAAAIDAFLDTVASGSTPANYEARRYQPTNASDPTRAFGAVRLATSP